MSQPHEETLSARQAALTFRTRKGPRHEDARRRMAGKVDAQDRGLFLELVAGTTRHRVTLDRVLAAYSNVKLKSLHPRVLEILRQGLYQLAFLDGVPDHAVVNESVSLVPERQGEKARAFVNAMLRAIQREGRRVAGGETAEPATRVITGGAGQRFLLGRDVLPDPDRDAVGWLAAHYGFGREAVELYLQDYELPMIKKLFAAANRAPQLTIRRNPRRASEAELYHSLAEEGASVEPWPDHPAPVYLWSEGGDPTALTAFRRGLYTVQGAFASRVVPHLDPQPDENVLDVCAAPGGKACQIAESLKTGSVTALAMNEGGLRKIRQNVSRLGTSRLECSLFDGNVLGLAGEVPDAILLDVPCTNTGVLNRRPEARTRLTRAALHDLGQTQRKLLRDSLTALASSPHSSRLVYSTCSILAAENGRLVREVLTEFPRARIGREIREMPLSPEKDGGYAAVVIVVASDENR